MKIIYLLDTNIISQVTKPLPAQGVITNLELHAGSCAISSITWFELLNGVGQLPEGAKKEKLRSFIMDSVQSSFPIIPYDEHAAWVNADITEQLIHLGKPTPILDTQIASIAIANNLILVTDNIKDFQIFCEYGKLMLENWG